METSHKIHRPHIKVGKDEEEDCVLTNDALKIYYGSAFDNGHTRDIATILKKFDEQIIGELNETYERYKFNSSKQATGERFDMYLTDLRHLAKNCNFCNCLFDTLLRDRIVMGMFREEKTNT